VILIKANIQHIIDRLDAICSPTDHYMTAEDTFHAETWTELFPSYNGNFETNGSVEVTG
jgi:hypothetical protein